MASIIWKNIYPLTNEAANYLAEQGEIKICIHSHKELIDAEMPTFHPVAADPTPVTILEMVERGHEMVGANTEEVSRANLERYFNTKED